MARDEAEKGLREEYGRALVPWVDLERKRGQWEGKEVEGAAIECDPRVWCGRFSALAPESAVEAAFATLAGDVLVRPGQRVLVKVNLGGGLPGCPGSYTDPDLVRGVIRWARARGAVPVVAEGDQRACRADTRLLKARGYDELLLDEGASFESLSRGERARLQVAGLDAPLDLPMAMLDPHVLVVNAYAPKYHWECGITAATKNLYGALYASTKGDFHRVPGVLDRVVAAAARLMRPAISLGGGSFLGSGLGPHFTVPVRIDRLIAHRDVAAGDRFWCDVLDYPWQGVEHLRIARAEGESEPSYQLVEGSIPLEPVAVARIRRHAVTPRSRARWKQLLWSQYFVPHRFQRALYPLAESLAARLNQSFNHPKGDPV